MNNLEGKRNEKRSFTVEHRKKLIGSVNSLEQLVL